ncbi:histidine ammonia-lyase [Fulvivirga sedimenti]|uniref:Histidine ammonia-lyase n=1 Tax=Fulvivirga sedimenti TaxID=2879465 RepID=A0A9X1KV86_9BACT|nr:histidine ammonia-lyase [Fulvivirga sedimenti]MCA6073520.1 histidine ammonia-lyase [Fulvivirga sedimenti]
MEFKYGEDRLTIGLAMQLARRDMQGVIGKGAREAIHKSWQRALEIAGGTEAVYGVNTGFGPLCSTRVSSNQVIELQYNLLRSHSVGVGAPIPDIVVRLMLITKIHSLARGYSGIQPATLERMMWHLDHNILPIVPEKGSVGASGDLAPLAHLCLPLIGDGYVMDKGVKRPAGEVLSEHGLKPLSLGPKEGLALINGTQFILAFAVAFADRFSSLLDIADIAGALSLEGLEGSSKPFDNALHELRPYAGSRLVASRLRKLLEGSEILKSHEHCERVQDPYSLRCMPAVHGASRNAYLHLDQMVEVELNSVTDNPILLPDGRSVSGGNFHGQPLAIPLDYATIAAAELGNISERRSYLMLEGKYGLPSMLIKEAGVNSGFMIPQYTQAALVTENRAMCFPTSADSVPTGMGQEDHVSMGSISARKAYEVAGNVYHILSIEIMYAAQAMDFRRPRTSSPILETVHKWIRSRVEHVERDRIFSGDMEVLHDSMISGEFLQMVARAAEELELDINSEL